MSLMTFSRLFHRPRFSPATVINGMHTECNQLLTELVRIRRSRAAALDLIVPFFNAVSTFQDSGVLKQVIAEIELRDPKGLHQDLLSRLKDLDQHVINAGRNENGRNRTLKHQRVTEHDVYLGDICGYWTRTVAYIKAQRQQEEYQRVMEQQARRFIDGHVGRMIELIGGLFPAATVTTH